MKKYKFVCLFIELTRRCNQACAHCCKGETQNLSMSTAIIDKIFSDIADCQRVIIGSGEATLEIIIKNTVIIQYFLLNYERYNTIFRINTGE